LSARGLTSAFAGFKWAAAEDDQQRGSGPERAPTWDHGPPSQLSGMSSTGVDRVPQALAVAPPAGAHRPRRALGWVPVIVAVDEAVAPTPLGRPGARVVVHPRIVRHLCDG
jgi:hypothetical protein